VKFHARFGGKNVIPHPRTVFPHVCPPAFDGFDNKVSMHLYLVVFSTKVSEARLLILSL
jgi:hypothetical protein